MRDRAVELDEKFSEALAPRRSRDAGAVSRDGGAGAPRRTSRKCIQRSSPARDTPEASAADEPRRRKRRAGRGKSQFADVNFPGRRSAGERARAHRATYLDLGRLEGGDRAGEGGGNAGHFGVLDGCGVWCVCWSEVRDRRAVVLHPRRAAILPTRKIFLSSCFFVWRSSHVFPKKTFRARRTFFVPTGTRKSRLATQKRFQRFPSGAPNRVESSESSISGSASRVFPFQTRDFARPAPGETSRKTRF